jgi:hypothetical protein
MLKGESNEKGILGFSLNSIDLDLWGCDKALPGQVEIRGRK